MLKNCLFVLQILLAHSNRHHALITYFSGVWIIGVSDDWRSVNRQSTVSTKLLLTGIAFFFYCMYLSSIARELLI